MYQLTILISSYKQKVKGLNTPDICTLNNVFSHTKNYVFPRLSEKNKRTFKYEWLDLFPWVCYLALEDGAYCLSCVLFGHRVPGKSSRITKLVSSPVLLLLYFKRHAGNNTGGEMELPWNLHPLPLGGQWVRCTVEMCTFFKQDR